MTVTRRYDDGRRAPTPAVVFSTSFNDTRPSSSLTLEGGEALRRRATLDSGTPGIRATIGLAAPLGRDLVGHLSPIADDATARASPPVPAAVPRLVLLSHEREHTIGARCIPEATRLNQHDCLDLLGECTCAPDAWVTRRPALSREAQPVMQRCDRHDSSPRRENRLRRLCFRRVACSVTRFVESTLEH